MRIWYLGFLQYQALVLLSEIIKSKSFSDSVWSQYYKTFSLMNPDSILSCIHRPRISKSTKAVKFYFRRKRQLILAKVLKVLAISIYMRKWRVALYVSNKPTVQFVANTFVMFFLLLLFFCCCYWLCCYFCTCVISF